MAKQGVDLVRDVCRTASREQGGTFHEEVDVAAKHPKQVAASDLTSESPQEKKFGRTSDESDSDCD